MWQLWISLTEGQGAVISGLLTIVAAALGVFLGSWLFGGRVSNLKDAIDSSQKELDRHSVAVENKLVLITERITLFEKSLYEKFGRFEQTVDDREAITSSVDHVENESGFDDLRIYWRKISNYLEEIAANADDGRKRAKYARVDRRQFWELIEKLGDDDELGRNIDEYYEANDLWQKYRNGRRIPPPEAVNKMRKLAEKLTSN